MSGLTLKKTASKPYMAPLGYPGRVTARKTLRFDIVHPEHGVVGQLSGDLHTSKNPKPMVDRGMVDAYLFAWAEHGGRKVGKGDFNLKSVYLTHHPDTGEKLADKPEGDEDYAKIHPSVKNLLGPARLRGVLSQLRSHGVQRVYSTMRTTGIRGVERPKPEGAPVKFFEPPTTVVPPFRLREEIDQLVEHLLHGGVRLSESRVDDMIRAVLTESDYSVFKAEHTDMLVHDPRYNRFPHLREKGLMSLMDYRRAHDTGGVVDDLSAKGNLSRDEYRPVSFHALKVYKGDQHVGDVEFHLLPAKRGQHAHIAWAHNTSAPFAVGSRSDEAHPGAFKAVVQHILRTYPKVVSLSGDRMSGAGQGARVWPAPRVRPQQRELALGESALSEAPLKIDNKEGLGSVPLNTNVKYMGFTVHMKPKDFLLLNPYRGDYPQHAVDHVKAGGAVGTPFLMAQWNDEGKHWQVYQHEGRGRMQAAHELFPNEDVPVHVFPRGDGYEMRARHLTPEHLFAPIKSDERRGAVKFTFQPQRVIHDGQEKTRG